MANVPDFEKRIAEFVEIRDMKTAMKLRHKAELEPINKVLETLGNVILKGLDTIGVDNLTVKGVGTAHKTTKKSATIKDKPAFFTYVKANNLWDLLDYKANPVETKKHIEDKGFVPAGVNYTEVQVAGVRRANGGKDDGESQESQDD